MRLVIAGDNDATTVSLKQWLVENNFGSDIRLFSLDEVADRARQFRPRVVILTLTSQLEQALSLIRDIQETLQTRILVIGPAADSKLILRILREGAFQYIAQDEIQTELAPALLRFDAITPDQQEFGRLITIMSAGGGTGASTVAANVAAGLAQRHGRCALLDLRLDSGDLATLLDLHPVHSLADFCRSADRMDAEMFSRCLTSHTCGIHLLAAPSSFRDFPQVTPRGVRKAIGMARSKFDYVVIDLDTPYPPEQAQALLQSDIVLLVLRLDIASVRQSQQLFSFFDEIELDRSRVQVVVSRYGRPKELNYRDVENTLGLKVQCYVPDDPKSVIRANNRGIPVVLDNPRAAVSRTLMNLSCAVNGRKTS